MFPFFMEILTMFILLLLLQMSQEHIHCLIPGGVCVWITKLDVDYGISLDSP